MARPKILVVDDETLIRNVISDILLPQNYEIIHASNGIEALEKTSECRPDVILLDVAMPKMDGFEVLQRLKNNKDTRIIPVVMITAIYEIQMRVKALELGVDDFLAKPMDIMELRARVRSLLKVKAYNDYMRNYQKKLESAVVKRTEDVRQALERAKKASYETVYILSRAAEYRDEDTGAHLLRVSHYSALLADKLGRSSEEVEAIQYGAPMHDVGKIGIPDDILLKPGKLTKKEFFKMQDHVNIGSCILKGSNSAFIRKGEEIVLSHHEKWCGEGYPKQVKGEKIPLAGRIVAIADVFDALTTKRPYKEPFTDEKACTIIREGRGEHFDPNVVDAFFDIFDKILKIKKKYREGESKV